MPDHPEGTVFMGEDFHGNKYYEAPRGESGSYLKIRRWMEPPEEITDDDYEGLGNREQLKVVRDSYLWISVWSVRSHRVLFYADICERQIDWGV